MPSSTKLKTKHNKSLLISSSVFSLLLVTTLVSGLVLSGTRTHADDTTQSDNVTVTVSSACTLSRSAGSGTYSATLNPGQETGDISGSTIKAICNDGNGYSLYAIGYSGDSYTGNNTKMIGTYGNIDTGTSGSDSWWAMKLAPVAGDHAPTIVNSFDNYHVVPATFTQVAKLTSATDAGESANGSSVDAFYKVKASTSQVAGTYTGKVKYTLVHPNAAPTPTIPPDMQNTSAVTALLPNVGDTATVRDSRDGKEYTVAKLADNNIWMTQNLAIEPGTHMTAADTNITSAQYNHEGYYALPGEGYDLRTDGTAASEASTGNCNSANNAGYINACTHVATQTDLDEIIAVDSSLNYSLEQLGAWYNYAAASAGTITGSSTTTEDTNNICPKGWTLPSHAQNSALATALSSDYSPFNPLYGGLYINGSHNNPATLGYWWSTTANLGTVRKTLRYNSGALSTGNNIRFFGNYVGAYVRCILAS